MTFMDVQLQRRAGSPTPSSDGMWILYAVTTPDWEDSRSQTDIHLVSLREGVSSNRRMAFTEDESETSPARSPDGSYFLFSSSRDDDDDH